MYRWILSSFRGIKVQYLLTSGAKRRRRPVLHLNSEEWRQYSPIHPTQTYRNHIVVKWKPRTFWLTNAILVLKGSTKNQYRIGFFLDPFSTKVDFSTEGVNKKPIHVLKGSTKNQYVYWRGHQKTNTWNAKCEFRPCVRYMWIHTCTLLHLFSHLHFTSNCLKHSKTWNLLTL